MNYSAEICAAVVVHNHMLVDELEDKVGLTAKTLEQLLGKLCGEGVLRREGDRVCIHNVARAKMLAEQAQPFSIPAPPPKEVALPKPKRHLPDLVPSPSMRIDKGMVLPPPRLGHKAKSILWPFAKMEIGDSFAVDVPEGVEAKQVAEVLRKDATAYKRILPDLRVAVRIEEGDKTVRLWRIDPDTPARVHGAPPGKGATSAERLDGDDSDPDADVDAPQLKPKAQTGRRGRPPLTPGKLPPVPKFGRP